MNKHFYVRIDKGTVLTGPSAKAGFIDHRDVRFYVFNGLIPASVTAAIDKCRANIRYVRMISNISEHCVIQDIYNVSSDASLNSEGTFFEFVVAMDHNNSIYTENELYGTAHPTGTQQILWDSDAIKRQVCRTFIYDYPPTRRFLYIDNYTSVSGWWHNSLVTALAPVASATVLSSISTVEIQVTAVQIP